MSTSTATYTHTSTHTATYLTEVLLGTLTEAIAMLGLAPTVITDNWSRTEAAILQWIDERSLRQVSVEFTKPSGGKVVIDFEVAYSTSGADAATFRASKDRILRFVAKYPGLPANTRTRLVVHHFGYHSSMPGWSATHAIDRSGLRRTSGGTLATAPGAAASMNISD